MKKLKVTGQTKRNGSSKPKAGNDKAPVDGSAPAEGEPKRRGRRAEEGEPLKRLLVFVSEGDLAALKQKVGDKRGVSTKVREIIKEWLAR
jgi:hypothetical protein